MSFFRLVLVAAALLSIASPAAQAAPLPAYNLSGLVKFNLGSPLRLSEFGPVSLVDPGFGPLSFTASGTPAPSLVASAQIGPGPDPNISGSGSGFLEYAFEILGPSGLVPVSIDVAGAVSGFATSGASFVVESRWDLLDGGVSLAGDDIRSGQLSGSFSRSFGHTLDVTLAANHVYSIFMLADAFAAAGIAGSRALADASIDPVLSFGAGVDPAVYSFSFSAGIGNSHPASVPEPSTLALLATGLFLLGLGLTYARSPACAGSFVKSWRETCLHQ